MTRLVVDANVAIKWLVAEDHAVAAARVLEDASELHAPRVMAAEIANVLWQKERLGEIDTATARILADSIETLPLHWADDERVLGEAVRLASELDRPPYDCMYLALANRLGARLVSADTRFVELVARTVHAGAVVGLVDYARE